jgi:hypothetical protein
MFNKEEINLIDIQNLSNKIQISTRWIRKQIKLKVNPMPHYRVGARIRFYYPKVLDWLDAKTVNKLF